MSEYLKMAGAVLRRDHNLRIVALLLLALVFLGLPNAARGCEADPAGFARYYDSRLDPEAGFFKSHDSLMRLAYLAPASRESLSNIRQLAQSATGPVRYLALWAIARIAPDNPLVQLAISEAAQKFQSSNLYEVTAAAAFLAQAGEAVPQHSIDRFLPPLYNWARDLEGKKSSVLHRATVAWALYEIGQPMTLEMAEKITQKFVDDPFVEGSLLTGIDAFEVIGPHARTAVPLLIEIVEGKHEVSSFIYKDDAARALMIVGGREAEQAFAAFMTEARKALFPEPSAGSLVMNLVFGTSEDGTLGNRLADLTGLLPYSYCAGPEVKRVLAEPNHAAQVFAKASDFLIELEGDPTGIPKQ